MYSKRLSYKADAEPFYKTICHCTDCRRIVGAASVAWFTVPRASLHWTGGEPATVRSSTKAVRRFCGTCSTSLSFESNETPDEIDVTTASLDDADAVPPKDHTRTASRLAWDIICDGLPVYSGTRRDGPPTDP